MVERVSGRWSFVKSSPAAAGGGRKARLYKDYASPARIATGGPMSCRSVAQGDALAPSASAGSPLPTRNSTERVFATDTCRADRGPLLMPSGAPINGRRHRMIGRQFPTRPVRGDVRGHAEPRGDAAELDRETRIQDRRHGRARPGPWWPSADYKRGTGPAAAPRAAPATKAARSKSAPCSI
jgi:hypothetical protein